MIFRLTRFFRRGNEYLVNPQPLDEHTQAVLSNLIAQGFAVRVLHNPPAPELGFAASVVMIASNDREAFVARVDLPAVDPNLECALLLVERIAVSRPA